MHTIDATAYHPPSLQTLRQYNVNRGVAPGLGTLGNEAFLLEVDRQADLEAARRATWQALSTEEQQAKLAADAIFKATLQDKENARNKMNRDAPIAPIPLQPYQEKMRRAIYQADFEAFNLLVVISKFGWGSNTPLGMYRFRVIAGKRIYKPFSDVDLARLFQYMSTATNTYGYNRFAEPGSSCDWNVLLNQYVNMQIAARRNYPNTDWRHVVEIYPGRYICQVYKPSLWVKIRKPVVAAVAIVAAIYLGPIVMAKLGEGAAAGAGGTAAAAGEATIAVTGVTATAATTTATVAVTTAEVAGAVVTAAQTGGLLATTQQVVGYINQARSVAAIVQGELPPPPIGISGDSFTEWALDIAKDELIKEVQERTGEYLSDKAKAALIAEEEARLKAEIQAMQAELAKLVPPGTPIIPSDELDADVRARIIEMQEIERQRQGQNTMLLALAAGAGVLMFMS